MKTVLFYLLIGVCIGVELCGLENSIVQADRLFIEKLYMDACPLYEKALQSNPKLDSPIYLRLAICYLELSEDQKALELLSSLNSSGELKNERDYLLALTYRHLGLYHQALELLESIKKDPLSPEIQLEFGLNYYSFKEPSKALEFLKKIDWNPSSPYPFFIAQLHLSRIFLESKEYNLAQGSLDTLAKHLPQNHLLRSEFFYLQGLLLFLKGHYREAADALASSITKTAITKYPWIEDSLYYQAYSYLKQTSDPILSDEEKNHLFLKAEECLKTILLSSKNEKYYFALAEVYAEQAFKLKQDEAYQKAKHFLSNPELFTSFEEKNKVLLLQAKSAPTYLERLGYFKLFTDLQNKKSSLYAQGWFLRGLNDYEEGLKISNLRENEKKYLMEEAAIAFATAFQLFKQNQSRQSAEALKYQALAYYHQEKLPKIKEAWLVLQPLTQQKEKLNLSVQDCQEIFYLAALMGRKLHEMGDPIELSEVIHFFEEGLKLDPTSEEAESISKALASFYWEQNMFLECEKAWSQLLQHQPHSSLCGEAWYWRAKCMEQLKDLDKKKLYLQHVYSSYPESFYAPQAYINMYSKGEYLQGGRKAIKHLSAMPAIFPEDPLIITAYYLLGLDFKKERFSDTGKIIHHKDLIAAIHAFQQAETQFDRLSKQNQIPKESYAYNIQIRFRANLERALANKDIANESDGAKKKIYLQYAEEVLTQIQEDFHTPRYDMSCFFVQTSYPNLLEETEFQLTSLLLQEKKEAEADTWFNHMLTHYQAANKTESYFLAKSWYEKGKFAQEKKRFQESIDCFSKAETACSFLKQEEKLDLWIQQSQNYKALGMFNQAMLLLSKVVNDEAISGLRVKAMYLRSEIYELLGRPELAIKQLEATSTKGGEWGIKAKEKLTQLTQE